MSCSRRDRSANTWRHAAIYVDRIFKHRSFNGPPRGLASLASWPLSVSVRPFRMRHRLLTSTLAIAVTFASSQQAQSQAPADVRAFHSKVVSLYSFEPHTLTSQQIEAKSAALDTFWAEVKRDPKKYRPLLRRELRDTRNSAFFSYNGSKLLLAISTERDDQTLALEAIPKADLRSIQHTDYFRTVHWFARNGFNTTTAALRILDYPDFKAFIAQHVLTLGQDYSLIYLLFPMPESNYLEPLLNRLKVEDKLVSQKSILLALWYSMTPEGNAAAARFMTETSKPQEARNYAKQLFERKAPKTSAPSPLTVRQLKKRDAK